MSSRPLLSPFQVITNGSMAASITSAVTIITNCTNITYDIAWTAGSSPVGSMSVQVSNSYAVNSDGSVRNAGNWTTVALSNATSVSGNTGNGFIEVPDMGAYAIRLVYTRVSGSGTMNATICAKVA